MPTRSLFFATVVVVLYSFSTNGCNSAADSNRSADSAKFFLALFQELPPEDLHIYSPDQMLPTDKFSGTKIDISFYRLMNFKSTDASDHYYACNRFRISDEQTGLLIRRPSQYTESAVDLYVWNNASNTIEQVENLADAFGDEGWLFAKDCWLKDLNKDGRIDLLTRRKDFDQNMDDTTKIRRSDSLVVFLHLGNRFVRSSVPVDTQQYQLKYWVER